MEIIGALTPPRSETAAYAATNSRIDNIIAHNNDTEGNTELIDIRTGADRIVYASAGYAVREQNSAINKSLAYVRNKLGVWNINLLDVYDAMNNAVQGYYVDYNTGILRTSEEGHYATDYIPVTAGASYISNANNHEQGAFYNSSKQYISGYIKINSAVTAPENACYIRMSFKDWLSLIPWKLYQSATLPQTDFTAGDWFSEPVEEIQNKVTNLGNQFLRNLIGTVFTDGKFIHYANGSEAVNANYCYSDYIDVLPDTDYYFNQNAHIAFYDSSKTFLGGTLTNQSSGDYTTGHIHTPHNCHYMIVSFLISRKGSAILSEGNSETDYIPSGKICIPNLLLTLPKLLIVDQDGNGNYTTIAQAVSNAVSGTTIYIKSGIYNEIVNVPHDKIIYMVGENKLNTIIVHNGGNYEDSPVLIGAGKIENLTVCAQRNSSTPSSSNERAYAVHVERNSLYNETLYIKNCILKSDFYPALGMGMRGGCTVLLEDTDFILGSSGGGTAALYIHDADNTNYVGEQSLIIRNCRIINRRTNADRYAIKLQSQEREGTTVYLTMQNVMTRSFGGHDLPLETRNYYDGTSTNAEDFQGLINWRLSDDSYGNSCDIFNFIMP